MVSANFAYDEIAGFIASMDPQKLIQFKASEKLQQRVDDLLYKNTEGQITEEERSELEHFLVIDNIISLAKLRAQKLLNQQTQA
jgi:hypothetical protein